MFNKLITGIVNLLSSGVSFCKICKKYDSGCNCEVKAQMLIHRWRDIR